MTTAAVAVLILSSALMTASAFLQVASHPTTNPIFRQQSNETDRTSKWLFLSGIALIAAGSLLLSQSQGEKSTIEFPVFLIMGAAPVGLIRLIHNRRVKRNNVRDDGR
ncbi:Na+/proline symporter [Arthrobacter bambusae]|nr:Na+/proline symporter [Arthrobacter bambusae]MDQ0234228.1 Na+/proline symporter [Arthrobacter bambusae]